jgi:cytochrome P460
MTQQHIGKAIGVASVLVVSMALAAQERSALKSPNGIALSEFSGYQGWETIAPSQTDEGIKVIVGNAAMIDAYKSGIPGNGKTVPDGAMMAKIEWTKRNNAAAPFIVAEPQTLKSLSFMVKDVKRFPDTDGWGYAHFSYDPASTTLKPFGNGSDFAKAGCHQCHTRVKARDFVFTSYAQR